MLQVRNYTLQILRNMQKYMTYTRVGTGFEVEEGKCYLCKIDEDSLYFRKCSLIMAKMAVFIQDFIMFLPKAD